MIINNYGYLLFHFKFLIYFFVCILLPDNLYKWLMFQILKVKYELQTVNEKLDNIIKSEKNLRVTTQGGINYDTCELDSRLSVKKN